MDLYFERHDGEAATIEDFLKVFEDVSGRDLSQFALWYHQAGTPNLDRHRPHTTRRQQEFTLEIEQSVPPTPSESRKRLMHIPLAFGLVGPDGNDIAYGSVEGASVENGVIHIRKRRHVVRFSGVAERPGLVAQPRLLGAGTLSVEQRPEDQFFLARHDSDPFSRWQAFNTLLTEALIAAFRSNLGGKQPDFSQATRRTRRHDRRRRDARTCLSRAGADRCRAKPTSRARSARTSIPTRSLPAARRWRPRSPKPTATVFAGRSTAAGRQGRFSPDAASAGRRALRNALLDYLSMLPGGAELARRAFRVGDQHDRSRRGADRAGASACRIRPQASEALAVVRGEIPRRSAGHGQMVPDPGDGAGRRRGRHGRALTAIPASRWPIPTACAR